MTDNSQADEHVYLEAVILSLSVYILYSKMAVVRDRDQEERVMGQINLPFITFFESGMRSF